jgi:hypothetical protein
MAEQPAVNREGEARAGLRDADGGGGGARESNQKVEGSSPSPGEGRVAERLRHSSAKRDTPVRLRPRPPHPTSRWSSGKDRGLSSRGEGFDSPTGRRHGDLGVAAAREVVSLSVRVRLPEVTPHARLRRGVRPSPLPCQGGDRRFESGRRRPRGRSTAAVHWWPSCSPVRSNRLRFDSGALRRLG